MAKELANIRAKFTASKPLSAYDRKKYVWKLVYIHILGYEVDFGHDQVINLVSSSTFQEKTVGYLAAAVLLKNTDEQIRLVVQSIRNDLTAPRDETQCLALSAISNIGGPELAESLAGDVGRVLCGKTTFPIVRKKAAITLLRLFRVNPDLVPNDEWAPRIVGLLDDPTLSVVMAVATLMLGLCARDSSGYEACVPQVVLTLTHLAVNKRCSTDYLYYQTANPWMQVKMLRLLQYFPMPADATLRGRLGEVLSQIINHTEVTKSVNKNNGDHSILFEAVNLIIHYGEDCEARLRDPAVKLLSRFISVREPNIRYLGLDTMSRIAHLGTAKEEIKKHQNAILYSLKDQDVSIRKRALDLMFAMADRSNATEVVRELLSYLAKADYQLKGEMVLKIAILAERHAPNFRWYVDTLLQMINIAGDFVGDDIWHRAVQIVTNHNDGGLQKYAAHVMYEAVKQPLAHEAAVKVAGYVLGEFGYWLNEDEEVDTPDDDFPTVSGAEQFEALRQHMGRVSDATKALLLSSFAKMHNLYPELGPAVREVLSGFTAVMDTELQQRAVEYLKLPSLGEDAVATVLDPMPKFPERESVLEARMRKERSDKKDGDRWGDEGAADDDDAGDDDDDDDDEEEAPDTAPPAAAKPTAAAAPEEDLLGLGSGSTPAPALPQASQGGAGSAAGPTQFVKLVPEQKAQVLAWLNALVARPAGVLYEDAHVMVGAQVQVKPPEARLMLHVRNKTGGPLRSLKLRVPALPAVATSIVGEVPPDVDVGGTAKVQVAATCMAPFADPPALQLSFLSAGGSTGHAYALKLPVFATSFLSPVAMDGATFNERWAALAGGEREAGGVLQAAGGAASEDAAVAHLKAARVGVVGSATAGATPVVFGAASFRTATKGKSGEPISVGVLVRVDVSATSAAYRMIVRAQSGGVAAGVRAALAPGLGSPPPS